MPPPRPAAGSASERRFLIAPLEGGLPRRLAPEEVHHARNVLRLRPGDELVGLDGAGGLYPLRVAAVARGEVLVEAAGEVIRVPAPGEPGAPLPPITVASALPRGARAEAMVERLTQLGVQRIVPLATERSDSTRREWSDRRRERLERACREACKQSIRAWFPELAEPAGLDSVLAAAGPAACLLEPRATEPLGEWIARRRAREARTWTLIVGPEGGWTDTEREAARASGAGEARIAHHVLRVETAAEAGAAVLGQALL